MCTIALLFINPQANKSQNHIKTNDADTKVGNYTVL